MNEVPEALKLFAALAVAAFVLLIIVLALCKLEDKPPEPDDDFFADMLRDWDQLKEQQIAEWRRQLRDDVEGEQ